MSVRGRIFLALFFCIIAVSLATPSFVSNGQSGTLVLCGGGLEFSGKHLEVAGALRELAHTAKKGGRPAKLASLHSGAATEKAARLIWDGEPNDPGYQELFTKLDFQPVFIPIAPDNYQTVASDSRWVAEVDSADAVFLNGGDQIRHTRALMRDDGSDSPLLKAVKRLLERGGTVIGTSAGLHAQGARMFGGGTSRGALERNVVRSMTLQDQFSPVTYLNDEMATPTLDVPGDTKGELGSRGLGFGFLKDILLDSHSGARGRQGRMLVAQAATGDRVGFGVDENTCLFWDLSKAKGTVHGEHGVWVLDTSSAKLAAKAEAPFRAEDVRLSFYSDGDVFDADHLIETMRDPVETKPDAVAHFTGDPFDKDGLQSALQAAVLGRYSLLRMLSGDAGKQRFSVELALSSSGRLFVGKDDTVTADQLQLRIVPVEKN